MLILLLLFVCASASAQTFTEDFETYSTKSEPAGWLDSSFGKFSIDRDPLDSNNMVYGAKHTAPKQRSVHRGGPADSPRGGSYSTLSGRTFDATNGFEYRGRFWRADQSTLAGFTFFSSQPEGDTYHLIGLWRRGDETAPTMRSYRGNRFDQDSGWTPPVRAWVRFAIRVDDGRIRVRFWNDGAPEPQSWHIDHAASDETQRGRIGLWAAYGTAWFDDLAVTAAAQEEVDTTPPAIHFFESDEPLSGTAAFARDARVIVRAIDASGIRSLTLTLDGAAYESGVPIAAEKSHLLRARAIDNKGNEASASLTIVIDKTKPVIAISGVPELTKEAVTPSISTNEGTLAVTLNGAPFVSGTAVDAEREHHLVAIATDAVGNQTTERRTFVIDRTAPLISLQETGARNSSIAVQIAATDAHGVASLTSTLDGAPYVSGTAITAEGTHALVVRAVDRAGNEAVVQREIRIDLSGPVIRIDGVPEITKEAVTPAITTSDGTLTVTLNGAPFVIGTTVDAEGQYLLVATATDGEGNSNSESRAFVIDRTKPELVLNESGARNDFVAVSIAATDAHGVATLNATLNGATYTSGDAISNEGTHALIARAVDRAGNEALATREIVIDKTKPAIAISAIPEITNDAVTPAVTTNEGTLVVTLNDAPFVSGTTIDAEREHVLVATATDDAGNVTVETRTFIIDKTKPELVLSESGARNDSVAISIAATDAHGVASLTSTLNGAPYTSGDAISVEGTHALIARAVDRAGNEALATREILIDKTKPVVTIANVPELTSGSVTPSIVASEGTLTVTLNGSAFTPGTNVEEERAHVLVATAVDAAGNSGSATASFRIDRTPPVLIFTSPAAESRHATRVVTVTGTYDDATRIVINGVEATLDATARTFTATIELAEGANTLAAIAFDAAGNEGTGALRLHLDTRPPRLAVTGPAANACISATQLTIKGTIEEATSVAVTLVPPGAPGSQPGASVNATINGTTWTAVIPVPEGEITVAITATDGAQTASHFLPLTIDRTKPTIAVTERGAPFTTTLTSRDVIPTLRATDADPAAKLTVTLDGAPYVSGTVIRSEGAHLLRATAVDCAGNSSDPIELAFTIDKTPPSIVTTQPANGAAVGAKPALTGTLSEPAAVMVEATGLAATVSGTSFTLAVPFEEGLNELALVATDLAGNSTRTPYALRLKTSAPHVEIVENGLAIPAAALFNRPLAPVIRVSDAGATITATLNGQPFTSGSRIAADGAYTLAATATDAFGHVSEEARATFTIDRTPPRIAITAPAADSVTPEATVEVRGTVDADVDTVTINGLAASVSSGAFTSTVQLSLGANVLAATAVDRAGNSARDHVAVARHSGRLALIITSPPDELLTNRPTTVVAGQVLNPPPSRTVRLNGTEIPLDAAGAFRKLDFPLAEGANEITAAVAGATGEWNEATVDVTADFTPPALVVTANGIALGEGARFALAPRIALEATDNVPAGLTTRLVLDGAEVQTIPVLNDGGHALTAIARDAAGNETRIDRTFFVGDTTGSGGGCALTAIDPKSDSAVFGEIVRISGRSGGAQNVLIDGKAAQVADGSFCGEATLQPGRNEVVIRCADASGNPTSDAPVTLVLWRDAEPSVTIDSPADGANVTTVNIDVSGTIDVPSGAAGSQPAGDGLRARRSREDAEDAAFSGDVNGIPMTIDGDAFTAANAALTPGLNVITARVKSGSGRVAVATTRVILRNGAPQIGITSPLTGTTTGAGAIDVSGTYVHVDPGTIRVAGSSASVTPLSDTHGTFTANVTLPRATSTATGRNHAGAEASASVEVTQTIGHPSISIANDDNDVAENTPLRVTGSIVAEAGSQVQINGTAAALTGSTFEADIAIPNGTTPIVARVTTPNGAVSTDTIRVTRNAAPLAVRDTFPAANATNVDRGVSVILLFNNALAAPVPVTMTDGSGASVAGIAFTDRDALTFAPNAALRAGETYTVAAAGQTLRFTTAATAPAAPPLVDDLVTEGCLSTVTLTGRATEPGARVRLEVDGITLNATANDSGAFKFTFSFSGQPGFHLVRIRQVGTDGSLSADRALCFRVNCELPRVVGATLDRGARKLVIDFSRPMDASTLTAAPDGTILVVPDGGSALTGSVTVAGESATIAFAELPEVPVALTVKKSVEDTSGASMAADYTQRFAVDGTTIERGKGYVTGAVYDATNGRPLANARITISGETIFTSDRGRYSRALYEGAFTIEAGGEGYTSAWRQVVVPAGAGVVPIDIRLTRRSPAQTATGAAMTLTHGGDTTVTRKVELTLAAASLPPSQTIHLTATGAQSLAGLLPLGWSPHAAAEVVASSDSIPGATLAFHVDAAAVAAANQTLSLVRYDAESDEWRVVAAVAAIANDRATFPIDRTGHYALVYPDAAAHLAKPPAPSNGAVLRGVVNPCTGCALTSRSFTLEPRAILPSGRAVATLITAGETQPYPSGTAVQAYIDEQLNLADGRVLADPPFATDLLVYRTLAGDAGVAAFHLAPTPQAAAVMLRDGIERIRIVDYPGRVDRGTLVGAEGGRVPGDGSVTIDVPPGATLEPLHASTAAVSPDVLASYAVEGFRVAGGFTLALTTSSPSSPSSPSGAPGSQPGAPSFVPSAAPEGAGLESPALQRAPGAPGAAALQRPPGAPGAAALQSAPGAPSLLIPARATFHVTGTPSQVLIAEVLTQSAYGLGFRLVAIAEPRNGLWTTKTIDSTQLPLDGIVRDGRYLILAAEQPVAYAFGQVRTGTLAIANARVSANDLGVTGLTGTGGLFVLPVLARPAAPFSLVARTPATGDGAAATAGASPEPDAFVDFGVLQLVPQPPGLRSIAPDSGEVPIDAPFVVRAEFDVPIDPATVAGTIAVVNLTTGAPLSGTVTAAGHVVTFHPGEPLRAASQYGITVGGTTRGTIRGLNGAPFGRVEVRSFTTSDRPRGSSTLSPALIRLGIPDAGGKVVIRGAAGALPHGSQAVAVRRGRFFVEAYQATVAADGSFSFEAGHRHPSDAITIDDLIDLQVVDAVSRAVIAMFELTPFTRDDARAFVARHDRETRFTSIDGLGVTVPAGAFESPTIVEVLPSQRSAFAGVPSFDTELAFANALELNFEGVAGKPLGVSMPIPAGTDTTRNWLLGWLGQSVRGPRVMIVDFVHADGSSFATGLAPASPARGGVAANATGPELRQHLMKVNRSGIYATVNLSVGYTWGVVEGLQSGYDLFWNTLESLYASHLFLADSRGRVAIPVVAGKQFQVVGVDASTGLEAFSKAYDPLPIADPGSGVALPAADPDRTGPYPIFATPFRVELLDLNVEDVAIESTRDFTVTLHNARAGVTTTLPQDVAVTLLNVTRGLVDPSRSGGLSVDAAVGDRLVLLIAEQDVDPYSPVSIVFDEPLDLPGGDADLAALFRVETKSPADAEYQQLTDALRLTTDSGGRRVLVRLPASLTRGNRYRIAISPDVQNASGLRIGQTRGADGTPTAPLAEPLYLELQVRQPGDRRASFDVADGVIRDQALNGNVLLVSAGAGGIFAYDVSDPAAMRIDSPPLPGRVPGTATDYWAVASDHHGRVFATGLTSLYGVVQSFRLEQFISGAGDIAPTGGAIVSFAPGAAIGLEVGSRVVGGDRAEAVPRRLQILVQDAEVAYDDRADFKEATQASVLSTVGELEMLELRLPRDPGSKYATQRITVENVTLDMRWSADATISEPARITGVVAAANDRLRVIRNDTTYGVVSLFGYGVGVYDLNAMESNDASAKPADYEELREQVRLTNAARTPVCGPLSEDAIPDLTFTPDAAIVTRPGSSDLQIYALDVARGVLDLNIAPPEDQEEGALVSDRLSACSERAPEGLVFRNRNLSPPAGDSSPCALYKHHPRLRKVCDAFVLHANRVPFGRFTGAAYHRWTVEANDNARVSEHYGQRGTTPNTRATRDYLLIPANEYGLLVVEIPQQGWLAPRHLADVIWIPHGAWAVRTIPRTNLASVVDGEGHVLLIDLARIDERWNEEGDLPPHQLFGTAAGLLERSLLTPDPRIVWRSATPLATGTLAPVVDGNTGFVYVGKILEKTTEVVAAIDPRIQVKADLGAPDGLSEVGGIVPLGIEPPAGVVRAGENASLAAFRVEVALPGWLGNGAAFPLTIENERVPGARADAAPFAEPRAHLQSLAMQRVVPDSLAPSLRFQRGFNKFISPWIVAVADPRASAKWQWPAGITPQQKAEQGCFSCDRPRALRDKGEADGVHELWSNGRTIAVRAEVGALPAGYDYLGMLDRLVVRVPTVMADTIRPPEVLVAGQAPPVGGGLLQETTYLHSGEVETSTVDLVAGGRGGWDVAFDRTWRSRTLGGTSLGSGWESMLFRRLRALPTGDVEYRDGAGELWRFRRGPSGAYLRPKGLFLNLTRTSRGWMLVDRKQRMTEFDELGRLVAEFDEFTTSPNAAGHGNAIRYVYGADGRLARVIDPVGRVSTLRYGAGGLLESITDWRGRVVRYEHEDRRLVRVRLPQVESLNPVIAYGYGGPAGSFNDALELATNIAAITDPAGTGPRVTFTYGPQPDRDKATKQAWTATGESATFSYSGSVTTTVDALGQKRVYALSPQPRSYDADRAHVTSVEELDVATGTFDFGTLPAALTAAQPPRAPRTRSLSYAHDAEGLVRTETLAGVSTTTQTWVPVTGAPGFVLQSTTTAPVAGAAGGLAANATAEALTFTFGYEGAFLKSMTAAGGGAPAAPVHFTAVHRSALSSTASNDRIEERVQVDPFGRPKRLESSGGTDAAGEGTATSVEYESDSGPLHARGLAKQLDRGGLITQIVHAPQSVTVTDERGVVTTTELDAWLRPKRVVTAAAAPLDERIRYDANGRVQETVRRQGDLDVRQTFTYDDLGRLTASTTNNVAVGESLGQVAATVAYDLPNRKITRTLPGGAVVVEQLDGLGRVQTRITTTGSSDIREELAYDLAGNVVWTADNHLAAATAYDVHGRPTASLYPDGTKTVVQHDAWGRPADVQELDAQSQVTSHVQSSFTPAGRMQSVSSRVDASRVRQTLAQWDGAGRTTSVEAAGRATVSRFDRAGRLVSSASGAGSLGNVTEAFTRLRVTGYDGALAAAATVAEKGSVPVETSREHDAYANVTAERVGDLEWRRRFDQAGNLVAAAPPERPETAFDRDARGSVLAELRPENATIRHGYDASGAPEAYRDPVGEVTSTESDRIGRPLVRTYADGTTETFTYDGPRLLSTKDRQGRRYTYVYNARGQVSELRAGGGELLERYAYDDAGRLSRWTTRDAELDFEDYDFEGRPRRTRQRRFVGEFGAGGVLNELVQEHEWSVHGERTAWTMPSYDGMVAAGWTRRVDESHDAAGNVTLITRTLFGAASPMPFLAAAYRNSGRPDLRTLTTASGVPVTRTYAYDPADAQLVDLRVAARGLLVAGSRVEHDGLQVSKATLHGVSAGARANEYSYDGLGRLRTSAAAREQGSPRAVHDLDPADFRHALQRPAESAGLPSVTFTEQTGHKIAAVTRGEDTRTFSYGDGAERLDDGRFLYEFDARGRLVTATEKGASTASPLRRIRYVYSPSDRVVGRRAEYTDSAASGEWKLEDRPAVLAADALPADTTFAWDPVSDRLVAIFGPNGELLRQFIHGGDGYDDPLEVAIADGGAVRHLYPVFDEAAAGTLQVVLNTAGEVVSRTVFEDAYGGDESTLTGAAVDRIAVTAAKTAAGALASVDVAIRLTEALAPETIPAGARLAAVDAAGAVVALSSVTPGADGTHTIRWTLTPSDWQTLTATPGARALSIAVTGTLRAAAWSADSAILPPPPSALASHPLHTSAALPVEYREPLGALVASVSDVPAGAAQTRVLYAIEGLGEGGRSGGAGQQILIAQFQALPFAEPATGLVFARARWYDPTTGSFLTPDPMRYGDSSNLYAGLAADPVNNRDPRGEAVYLVYREFNDPDLKKSYPVIGHFYLAFDAEGLRDPERWRRLVRRIGGQTARGIERQANPDAETFSFHPTEVRDGDRRNSLVGTAYTEGSYIGYNDEKPDQEKFRAARTALNMVSPFPFMKYTAKGVKIWRIETTQEEQEHLYIATIAERDSINSGLNQSGSYLLGMNNCGSWAQSMLDRADLSWPIAARMCNLGGAGVGGPADLVTPTLTGGAAIIGEARKKTREFVEKSAQQPSRRPCGRQWCGDARGW